MSSPDYPLPVLGSYETYQLAHIATYIAERIARHHRSPGGRAGREVRAEAVRDLAGAATAWGNATGTTGGELPRPIDRATLTAARELLSTGARTAEVVSLAGAGLPGFAVVGHVPGLGPVGAQIATRQVADVMREHFLNRPAADLAAWVVTPQPQKVPTLPKQVDLAAFVEHLDPSNADDRAVARNLRGQSRRTDAAIRGRFARVDLDAPTAASSVRLDMTPPPRSVQRTATPTVAQTIAGP